MSEVYEITAASHSIPRAALAADVGVTTIRQAIARGDLAVHYVGTKPLILHNELIAWVESLPDERP